MTHAAPQPSAVRTHCLSTSDTPRSANAPEGEQLWVSQLAQSLGTDRLQLLAFASLMHVNQWPVDVSRLFMDSRYAYQRFALAHTSTDEPLRHLALLLFEGYQRLESRRKNLCTELRVLH
jgi:hypothetical protein